MFHLDAEFYQLPLRFDAARLAEEVLQFSEDEWRAHPQGHAGNTALPLVAVGGGTNDDVKGPMRPTPFLARCPYLAQVLASLGTVIGRARLMRIAGQSDATMHVDTNYYWMHHVRVHLPAVTYPEVRFLCDEKSVHMDAGEAWIFDSWKRHNVVNPVSAPRIHLVADTVGSAAFWELVARSGEAARFVPFVPSDPSPPIEFEDENFPLVMNPFEQQVLAARMLAGLDARPLAHALERLHQQWHALWTTHRDDESGWPAYHEAITAFDAALPALAGDLALRNGVPLIEALRQAIVRPALNSEIVAARASARPQAQLGNALAERSFTSHGGGVRGPAPAHPPEEHPRPAKHSFAPQAHSQAKLGNEQQPTPTMPAPHVLSSPLVAPVFIVSAPRSGSSMLFELLARSPEVWTVGGESHAIIESLPKLDPILRGYDSNRLTETDADPDSVRELQNAFFCQLRDRDGRLVSTSRGGVRMLEKTPKNALRIPFLAAAFPGARFIFLYREPRGNLSSILDAWRSQKFVTYPELPDWPCEQKWSMLLLEGWRALADQPLAEIAARQWIDANTQILNDLVELPPDDWCAISYDEVCADPQSAAERLSEFAGWRWDVTLAAPLPNSRHTLTPPDPEKWRRNEAELAPFLAATESVARRAAVALRDLPPRAISSRQAPQIVIPAMDFNSEHTSTFAEVLEALGITLAVSTYQAGKLIFIRAKDGVLNTHFRDFASPMGLAYRDGFLALGTKTEAWTFRAFAEPAAQIEPRGTHDALFLPATRYTTGDIRIHEIAWAGEELWAVNTRFSCLCTFDGRHNFVPRWQPPFITALAPEDRCHLNGVAFVEDAPAYVTCLGATDTAEGWRVNKVNGGLLLDVASGEVIASGLSMPHSPRYHDGKLWLLESGFGRLSTVDLATGKTTVVAELPGFTRGLDFHGPFAFIGLSQVRESAVFNGLAICEPGRERECGVWVVDTRSGATVAFLRFSGSVQEIFAVQALPVSWPELLNEDHELLAGAFFVPPDSLTRAPAPLAPLQV